MNAGTRALVTAVLLGAFALAGFGGLGACTAPSGSGESASVSISESGSSMLFSSEEPLCGGTTDRTDWDAPKTIESKDIVQYRASFYLVGEWSPGRGDEQYVFEVLPDANGTPMASEQTSGISYPADAELLGALQSIIDDDSLAAENGVYRVTAGLPPEFQFCELNVSYASGETLAFTTNNNPDAEWAKDTYLAFANWFAKQGDDSLLPPETQVEVAQLRIRFRDGDLKYAYGPIHVGEQDAIDGERDLLQKDVYDYAAQDTVTWKFVRYPDDYYDQVSALFNAHDYRAFDRASALYGRGRTGDVRSHPDNSALQIHVTCGDGHRLNIDTDDGHDIEMLRPLLNDLIAYHDSLFA